MPLHDWTDRPGWDGVHHLWIAELLRFVKPRLPAGYRAYIGTAPVLATLDPSVGLYVARDGRLISAIELVSPRNKDRKVARDTYVSRYAGYLLEGIHLLLVDVHRRPQNFSFAAAIAQEFAMQQPPCPAPFAVAYRVGEPAASGGRLLAIWRRPLTAGQPLPALPLPLSVAEAITVDLEETYARAAADAYLT